jgi:hypothetical protein
LVLVITQLQSAVVEQAPIATYAALKGVVPHSPQLLPMAVVVAVAEMVRNPQGAPVDLVAVAAAAMPRKQAAPVTLLLQLRLKVTMVETILVQEAIK